MSNSEYSQKMLVFCEINDRTRDEVQKEKLPIRFGFGITKTKEISIQMIARLCCMVRREEETKGENDKRNGMR